MEKYIKYFRFLIIPQAFHTPQPAAPLYTAQNLLEKSAKKAPTITRLFEHCFVRVFRARRSRVLRWGELFTSPFILSMAIERRQTEVTINGAFKRYVGWQHNGCIQISARCLSLTIHYCLYHASLVQGLSVGEIPKTSLSTHAHDFTSTFCSIYFVNCIILFSSLEWRRQTHARSRAGSPFGQALLLI